MNIAIIPARGGSKRIPRKNIKDFCGRPMIAWAITVAIESNLFEHIVVSTDDEEIASLARFWGAEVPFVRPADLADDLAPTAPVIAHAIKSCTDLGWVVDCVCCIYPCVPFLQIEDLTKALNMIREQDVEFSYPVTEYSHPVQRAMRRLSNGKMQFLNPEYELTRTQDLEKTYHDAGQFYWGKAAAWIKNNKIHSSGMGILIPSWSVVDIDSKDDWRRAELMFKIINVDRE